MTTEESIILRFSDDEIAMFFSLYGECPHAWHKRRLARIRETNPLFQPGACGGPIRGVFTGREAEIAWTVRTDIESRGRRYALENLLDKPLPKQRVVA